ncbi:MAG: EI24 domain-containing protein [Burkholderiaceae bacterium]
MHMLAVTLGRAVLSQLHPRMLLLTLAPFAVSVLVWAVVLWFGLQPAIDWLQQLFAEHQWFRGAGVALAWIGLGALKAAVVPLAAMWLLLPLMIVTALLFVGMFAMPAIARHVARRYYPALEARRGGTFLGSVWTFASVFLVFIVLWIVTLPLALVPPFTFLVHPLLWGWLTYRVMVYDALAEHADAEERVAILKRHRLPLLLIGAATGALGAAPTLLWLGGALTVVLFPVIAAGSIWLYVLVFTLTGLWFEHYCLAALAALREPPFPAFPVLPADDPA